MIIGDDASYSVKGAVNTLLKLKSGIPLHLSDVLFVPGIKRNLISISTLEDKGFNIAFSNGSVMAWKKDSDFNSTQIIGERHGSLYKLAANQVHVLNHSASNINLLWHKRFGHLNFKSLSSLGKFVVGLPSLSSSFDGVCKGCSLGKFLKSPFHSSENRSKHVLELIYSDLCGPMSSASLSGFWYYATFIDDCSRKT